MSKIEWTDHTVNVQVGCSRKSPGCEHCYAETQANALARRFGKPGQSGHRYLEVVNGKRWSREVVLDQAALDRPPHGPGGHGIPQRKRDGLTWRSPRVFLGSMTDHFHEKVTGEMMEEVISWMSLAPGVIWQLVTKRPERAWELLQWVRDGYPGQWPRIHLLATVEDQQRADERVSHLLHAAPFVELVGLSVEPLLGPVTIPNLEQLGWVIVGGESGQGARPCQGRWIASVADQALDAGVPVFVKQLGAEPMMAFNGGLRRIEGINDPKGGNWDEWPPALRWRQWPKVSAQRGPRPVLDRAFGGDL